MRAPGHANRAATPAIESGCICRWDTIDGELCFCKSPSCPIHGLNSAFVGEQYQSSRVFLPPPIAGLR